MAIAYIEKMTMDVTFEILESTTHSIIYIISEMEVGKVHSTHFYWADMQGNRIDFLFGDRNTIDEQIRLLKFANNVNDLLVKFERKDEYQGNEMLVMERLYPVSEDCFTKIEKDKFMVDLETKLKALHEAGFVHGDIKRPRLPIPECFNNIILTKEGFRLIDADFSSTLTLENIKGFIHRKWDEEAELKSFRTYFTRDSV